MSDLMFFWWIAAFLVISPIAGLFLIKHWRADGAAWWGIAMSGYALFTLLLSGVPASDLAAFLMVAAWMLLAPVVAWLIVYMPRRRKYRVAVNLGPQGPRMIAMRACTLRMHESSEIVGAASR